MHQASGPIVVDLPATYTRSPPRFRRIAARVARYHVAALVCLAMFIVGDQLRRWAWDQTQDIRYIGDVRNGYSWGSAAVDEGLLGVYRTLALQFRDVESPDYHLDYPPLRLAVVSLWARWTRSHFDA